MSENEDKKEEERQAANIEMFKIKKLIKSLTEAHGYVRAGGRLCCRRGGVSARAGRAAAAPRPVQPLLPCAVADCPVHLYQRRYLDDLAGHAAGRPDLADFKGP